MTATPRLRELAVGANRFAAVFTAISDGVVLTDRDVVVREANPAAHRLLRRSTLVGVPLADVLPPGRAELVDRSPERAVRRWRLPVEEGEVVVEVATTQTLDETGDAVGAVHTVRDVTAHAQLLRLKEEFLFSVAHELRTPVAAISASLDLLHQDSGSMSPEERGAMVATLRRSARRLEALVENLLDIGSIQAGTFEVRARATNLRRSIKDAVVLTEPLRSTKEQTVQVRVARDAEHVVADPRRTTQVLANLLSNASKYAPERTSIQVAAEGTDGFVRVSVRDEGPGIDAAERARVFDRFYRSRIARTGASGIGLGLAICRTIVEAQGGTIAIADSDGRGTLVHFTVPRARTEEER